MPDLLKNDSIFLKPVDLCMHVCVRVFWCLFAGMALSLNDINRDRYSKDIVRI